MNYIVSFLSLSGTCTVNLSDLLPICQTPRKFLGARQPRRPIGWLDNRWRGTRHTTARPTGGGSGARLVQALSPECDGRRQPWAGWLAAGLRDWRAPRTAPDANTT